MPGLILIKNIQHRLAGRRAGQNLIHCAFAIGIQHEDLSEVRARVAQQFQAIFLRSRKRLFMAIHHARGIILDLSDPDETHARGPF
jgi:hypothetical protein